MPEYNVGFNLEQGQSLSPIDAISTAISGIMANFSQGPLNVATLVTSMAQFETIFGTGPALGTTGYYQVKAFFAKVGSGSLYVVRIAGVTAAKSTHTFQDRQGTPADTLKIDAKYANSDGDNISIKILDAAILATTPSVNIAASDTEATLTTVEGLEIGSDVSFYNGTDTEFKRLTNVDASSKKIYWIGGLTNAYTTANGIITSKEFTIEVYYRGALIETWPNMSMNDSVSFFCESVVANNSNYITVTDLKAVDTDYQDLPAVVSTAQVLSSGADGLSDVELTDYQGSESLKTGVYAFDEVSDLFRFCVPNPLLTDADPVAAYLSLVQSMLDYEYTRKTLTYIVDVPYNLSVTDAVTFGNNFVDRNANFWYPWVGVTVSSLPLWLAPSSFVMGNSVEKDFRRGIQKNVGNEVLAYAEVLKYYVSKPEGEILNNANINTIRKFAPGGIRTYGGRSKSAVTAFRFIHYSEIYNFIGLSIEAGTRNVPFEPNDANLWQNTIRIVDAFLANQQSQGVLFDATNPSGKAYLIVMDEDTNPGDQVALGIARMEVEYSPVGTAEKFVLALKPSPAGLQLV